MSTPFPQPPYPPLLRPEFPNDDPRRMPFVRDRKNGRSKAERVFWAPEEAFPEYKPGEQGTLCAAAYLEHMAQRRASDGLLTSIVRDMPETKTLREVYFFRFLELNLHPALRIDRAKVQVFAMFLIEGERAAEKIIGSDTNAANGEAPTFPQVEALAMHLGVTTRDLIAGEAAYKGGAA